MYIKIILIVILFNFLFWFGIHNCDALDISGFALRSDKALGKLYVVPRIKPGWAALQSKHLDSYTSSLVAYF